MRRRLFSFCLLAGLHGCNDTGSAPEQPKAPGRTPASALDIPERDVALAPVTIAHGSLSATVAAPVNARVSVGFGVVHVSTPDRRFAIAIDVARGSLADRKRVIAENPLNRLVEYRLEQADALLYRSQRDGRDEFHVLARVSLSGTLYECTDRKGVRYSLPEAGTMLRACRSLEGARTGPP